VKSLLASKLGRTRSMLARMRSYDGRGRSIDVRIGIGGSRDVRLCPVKSVPSLPFWLRTL
jgi:hypothetical protein